MSHQASKVGVGAESIPYKVCFTGSYGIWFALIFSQSPYEVENLRDIVEGRRTNGRCHMAIVGCDADHNELLKAELPLNEHTGSLDVAFRTPYTVRQDWPALCCSVDWIYLDSC